MRTPLDEADLKLHELSSRISFFAVEPINSKEEKRKFFKKNSYNPQFMYEKCLWDIADIKNELREIVCDTSTMGKLLLQTRNLYYNDVNMLNARGSQEFTRYSKLSYGEPDRCLVSEAKRMLKNLKSKKEKKDITTKELISGLKYAFVKYGFKWRIVEKDMTANAAVNIKERAVMIKKGAKFSKRFLKRIVVHEIGTHVLRAENGEHQPYRLFRRGLPNYLMTEEGLAVVNEELNKCLDNSTLRIYAGRVLAIDKALKGSFRSTYNYLRKHFNKEAAWTLAVRAKRGLSDTSKQGGCTKDIAYLKGYLAVKDFIKKGGDLNKLYYGKMGLQHIDIVPSIPGVIDPMYLPAIRYFKYFVEHFSNLFKSIVFFDVFPFSIIKKFDDLKQRKL